MKIGTQAETVERVRICCTKPKIITLTMHHYYHQYVVTTRLRNTSRNNC